MDFKSTKALFSKIKEDLYSFDSASLIDEGRFHKDVKYILELLGINWFKEGEIVVDIVNYSTKLPADFKVLEGVWACDSCVVDTDNAPGVVLRKLTFDHYPDMCNRDPHDFECNNVYTTPCIFNRQEEILIPRGNYITKYSSPRLLRPGNVNTTRCCSSSCVNINSDGVDEFTIANGKIHTNFKTGSLYIQYRAFPLDDEGYPLIPDNEIVEKAIEYHIKANILETLWINSDADVAQKLPYFKQEAAVYFKHALYETKMPTFSRLVNAIRLKKTSLDIYQIG